MTTSGNERWIRRKERKRKAKQRQIRRQKPRIPPLLVYFPSFSLLIRLQRSLLSVFFVLLEISLKTEEFHKPEFRGTKIYGILESTVTGVWTDIPHLRLVSNKKADFCEWPFHYFRYIGSNSAILLYYISTKIGKTTRLFINSCLVQFPSTTF